MTCPFTMSAPMRALKLDDPLTSTNNGMARRLFATERKTPVQAAAKILYVRLITTINQVAAISAPVLALAAAASVISTANGAAQITGVWG